MRKPMLTPNALQSAERDQPEDNPLAVPEVYEFLHEATQVKNIWVPTG